MNKNRNIFLLFMLMVTAVLSQERRELSLNGSWEILFDEANIGRDLKWMEASTFDTQSDKKIIDVPSCWETYKENYEGVAFYKKSFFVPTAWKNKKIHLHFDAVNYLSEVFVNDVPVGFHEGGFSPFSFTIDHLVHFDKENQLTLRVVGPITIENKKIDGIGQMETPQWRGAYTGGIWQHVKLFTTDYYYLNDVFIQPLFDTNEVKTTFQIKNTTNATKNVRLNQIIYSKNDPETILNSIDTLVSLKPGQNSLDIIQQMKSPIYWSPNNPHLYQLKATLLHDTNVLDQVVDQFGMRLFTVKEKSFYLNNKPIYLKATFFEGLYPTQLAYPDSKEMVIKEIELAKEAGFNMIRPWRKPPPKMWLDAADSLGVLTVGSFAVECMGKPEATPYLPFRVENELRSAIVRDRNRASIVQWELFNELIQPTLKELLTPMSVLARELDPTRMILDESGGWAHGANLYLPFENNQTKFNDIHHYPGPNITVRKFDSFLAIGNTSDKNKENGLFVKPPGRNVIPNLLSYVSELGYGSLPDLRNNNEQFKLLGNPISPPYKYHKRLHEETEEALKVTGIGKMFNSSSEFYLKQQEIHGIANKRMIEAVRMNPNVGGYCIHALTAGDWIIGAGLLDLWRSPKKEVYEKTKEANAPQIAIIRVQPRTIYASENVLVDISEVNELDTQQVKVSVSIKDEKNTEIFSKIVNKTIKNGVNKLISETINTTNFQGCYTVQVMIHNTSNELISQADRSFFVFDESKFPANFKVAVMSGDQKLIQFFKSKNIEFSYFSEKTALHIPVVIGEKRIKDEHYNSSIDLINDFVAKGGNALFLEVPGKKVTRTGIQRSFEITGKSYLPSNPILKKSMGLWDGILHFSHKHSIFDGLPTKTPLVGLYENIAPTETMEYMEGERLVSMIAFNRFPDANDLKRNYIGPGKVWWGSDLVIKKHEKGRMLLSTLKIIPNLLKDPVADKLLLNMISYFSIRKTN